jgi:prepilin-type N-terminal cleavage/methylation domain-containing protein
MEIKVSIVFKYECQLGYGFIEKIKLWYIREMIAKWGVPINRTIGFSLVELMTALVIVSVLAAVGISVYSTYTQRAKVAEAYVTIDALQKAQITSLVENKFFFSNVTFTPFENEDNISMPKKGSKSPLIMFGGGNVGSEYYDSLAKLFSTGNTYYYSYQMYGFKVLAGIDELADVQTDFPANFLLQSDIEGQVAVPLNFRRQDGNEVEHNCNTLLNHDLPGLHENLSLIYAGSIASEDRCSIFLSVMHTKNGEITRRPTAELQLAFGPDRPRGGGGREEGGRDEGGDEGDGKGK